MNGQVERANGMVLQGIKPRIFNKLNKYGERWVTELPTMLWSLRTTPSQVIGYMPFFMVYGAEVVLPTDIYYRAPRVIAYKEQEAKKFLEDAMDRLMKHATSPSSTWPSISRCYAGTTAAMCRDGPLMSGI
jgi:hypothetical protein